MAPPSDDPGPAPASTGQGRAGPPTTTLVVMGVSGSGKTTLARDLARRLDWPFAEGDDFHPAANIEKMRAGDPLDDIDRWPWLRLIATWIGEQEQAGRDAVLTCSALKRSYRDLLREGHPSVWFAHVTASPGILSERLRHRKGHYMPPALLESQLAILEPLAPDEAGATVDAGGSADQLADDVLWQLSAQRAVDLPPAGAAS